MQAFHTPAVPSAIKNPDETVGEILQKRTTGRKMASKNNSKAHSPNRVSLLHKGGKSYMTQRVR